MKFKKEEIKHLRKNFVTISAWVKTKKKSDLKCTECKKLYSEMNDEKLALMITDKGNKHLCHNCADKYVSLGVEDVDAKIRDAKNKKESLISELQELYENKLPYRLRNKINDLDIGELLEEIKFKEELITHNKFIDSIDSSDWVLEDYLVKQYGVIMNKNYLKHDSQIEDYFRDCYSDYFDCGQGYAQDEAEVIICISEDFYKVNMYAELGSQKQNVGDRLYWVESLENIKYKKIEKPTKKDSIEVNYNVATTEDNHKLIKNFIDELLK